MARNAATSNPASPIRPPKIITSANAKNEKEIEKLRIKITQLESELQEAQNIHQKALSMAQQTRAGYVYIISNIGSFGKNIHKIGLTRRLNPMDRIEELSNASVPFPFDVHAFIYSDDAPALEAKLQGKDFWGCPLFPTAYKPQFLPELWSRF